MDWGWLAQLYTTSPLLAILGLIGALGWQYIKSTKKDKTHILSLANIFYLATSFNLQKETAEQERMQLSMDEAEELIEEYITERVCAFRDIIKPIIYSEDYHCDMAISCKMPSGHALETLYIEVYEKVIQNAFRTILRDIKKLVKNNGLTHRSTAEFDDYFTKRSFAMFEKVVKYMKKHYDDHIMPVPLRHMLNTVDNDGVKKLGLSIFRRARDHKYVYEDRIKTIEKEENEKITSFIGGDENGSNKKR